MVGVVFGNQRVQEIVEDKEMANLEDVKTPETPATPRSGAR